MLLFQHYYDSSGEAGANNGFLIIASVVAFIGIGGYVYYKYNNNQETTKAKKKNTAKHKTERKKKKKTKRKTSSRSSRSKALGSDESDEQKDKSDSQDSTDERSKRKNKKKKDKIEQQQQPTSFAHDFTASKSMEVAESARSLEQPIKPRAVYVVIKPKSVSVTHSLESVLSPNTPVIYKLDANSALASHSAEEHSLVKSRATRITHDSATPCSELYVLNSDTLLNPSGPASSPPCLSNLSPCRVSTMIYPTQLFPPSSRPAPQPLTVPTYVPEEPKSHVQFAVDFEEDNQSRHSKSKSSKMEQDDDEEEEDDKRRRRRRQRGKSSNKKERRKKDRRHSSKDRSSKTNRRRSSKISLGTYE